MRPLSLRNQMAEQAQQATAPAPPASPAASGRETDPLVQRLSVGDRLILASRADGSLKALQQSIERGLVHITFTETQGGTELGVTLDSEETDLSQADFEQITGVAYLMGTLRLNDVNVRCRASINLATLRGTGHLEPVKVQG